MVNLFITCELDKWSRDLSKTFTLGDCLFGAVMLTENAGSNKYRYSCYLVFDLISWYLI